MQFTWRNFYTESKFHDFNFLLILAIGCLVNRVHKSDPLIKLPFSTLYPSFFCCFSEHSLDIKEREEEGEAGWREREMKSSSTQMLLYLSQSGQILTSLNCCHMVAADIHQAWRAPLIRYSLKLLTRTATLVRGTPKAAN